MIQIDDSYSEEFKELYFEKVKTEFRRIIKKRKEVFDGEKEMLETYLIIYKQ